MHMEPTRKTLVLLVSLSTLLRSLHPGTQTCGLAYRSPTLSLYLSWHLCNLRLSYWFGSQDHDKVFDISKSYFSRLWLSSSFFHLRMTTFCFYLRHSLLMGWEWGSRSRSKTLGPWWSTLMRSHIYPSGSTLLGDGGVQAEFRGSHCGFQQLQGWSPANHTQMLLLWLTAT